MLSNTSRALLAVLLSSTLVVGCAACGPEGGGSGVDVYPAMAAGPEDGGGSGLGPGTWTTSHVNVTVRNLDPVVRSFNAIIMSVGPDSVVRDRVWFLTGEDLPGGHSAASGLEVPAGSAAVVGVSGYWPPSPDAWARHERGSAVAAAVYDCVIEYKTVAEKGVITATGCP